VSAAVPRHTVEAAAELMRRYADRTGLTSDRPETRYLWTDSFAVCNYLSLAAATADGAFLDLARLLVDRVHSCLARHRPDDSRHGWISGLSDTEGGHHPTAGGLRIGKPMPERHAREVYDPHLEWERDGQYFHYLTKWMHALDQVARSLAEPRFHMWACELAAVAHRGFVIGGAHSGELRMAWKMSIDLARPLVPSMGQHDPLDGYVTARQLQFSQRQLHAHESPDLGPVVSDFAAMVERTTFETADMLGIGGLLVDGCRLAQIMDAADTSDMPLLRRILAGALRSLDRSASTAYFLQSASGRLAFRELGLAIGLSGVEIARRTLRDLSETALRDTGAALDRLSAHALRLHFLTAFWRDAPRGSTWAEHEDINEVMLATSLLPHGFLSLHEPRA
jgi:hypothetical protein